ncbi:CRISPR-associated protein, Cas1 family [Desulfonauticus submarinus]|uniref:CRISPR-associated endonuclease Cas1 n=1 Tax=Desulfonauticus submarinus TaxID=206665 RepID=A0A1H0FDZ3_9BACT|nr:CRISPR-associated endonuclease Cas1 [Desulfonauticus submarinus]SDN92786.1 CRISPR-associated protein, Cas1 family [Desulfonauticus submarinus]
MAVVYITKPHSKVHLEGNHLLVKAENFKQNIYTFNLERLIIVGKVEITHAALMHIFRNNIDLVYLTRQGRFVGSFLGEFPKNLFLRLRQYEKSKDKDFSLQTACSIVRGKVSNMRTFVLRMGRVLKKPVFQQVADNLNKILFLLPNVKDVESLRGFEGQASKEYFRAYREGFSQNLKFKKRVKRPPTDPVNACLSFGYTVLFNIVLGACYAVGLDPAFGALHSLNYGRASLALDLMEEFRTPIVDMTVLACFNLKILKKDSFVFEKFKPEDSDSAIIEQIDPLKDKFMSNGIQDIEQEEADNIANEPDTATRVLLKTEAKRLFLKRLESRLSKQIYYQRKEKRLSLREIIYAQVEHYASYLRGEYTKYIPFQSR